MKKRNCIAIFLAYNIIMIHRKQALQTLKRTLRENPVAALLGPRQSGKSTLASQLVSKERLTHWFDLENSADRAALENPELALGPLRGMVVIDEIQRRPELFSALRPLADRPGVPARFLILGSASPDIVRGVSQTLAGRVGFFDLQGFNLSETGFQALETLWIRGGFPRSFLADDEAASFRWRENFTRTFLEQDIPLLGIRTPSETLRRFWTMLSHYHGQVWNGSELARAIGSSENMAKHYLDLLCGTYVARKLQPWHTNLGKRELKAPKVYIRDSGILHKLLGVRSRQELIFHPKAGASWEGFGIEQVLAIYGNHDAYFWGTHNGAELDLLLFRNGKSWGLEFKLSDSPKMTKSLHVALEDLKLEKAWIVYPGTKKYSLHEKVDVIPMERLASLKQLAV